jgi:predicted nucleic acid-binding protein
VTIGELTQWTRLRDWVRATGPRSMRGCRTSRFCLGRRPRPVNDIRVAACCRACSLPLATLNVKDFADFAERDGLVLI